MYITRGGHIARELEPTQGFNGHKNPPKESIKPYNHDTRQKDLLHYGVNSEPDRPDWDGRFVNDSALDPQKGRQIDSHEGAAREKRDVKDAISDFTTSGNVSLDAIIHASSQDGAELSAMLPLLDDSNANVRAVSSGQTPASEDLIHEAERLWSTMITELRGISFTVIYSLYMKITV